MDVPVVVNGDIIDLAAAKTALEQSGAAAVMLGRGAQGQPWLVGQIGAELRGEEPAAAPCGDDLTALVAEHYEAVLLEYGTSVGLRVARKHLDWYMQAAGIVLDKTSRNAFLNNENPAEVLGMIDTIFASERPVAA